MRELLEQGVGVAIIGGVSAVGGLARILLLGYYKRLGKACTRFEETKHKTIAYIREDLKRRREREQEIKNISVYTEYRLAEGRVCGLRVGNLEHAALYSVLLAGTSSVLVALAGVLSGCGYKLVLELLFAGGVSVTGLLLSDIVMGLREKNKRVRLGIRNYIENCFWMDVTGTKKTEEEPEKRYEKKTEKKEKQEMQKVRKNRSADKPKTAERKKQGKAQEEKRRLTEELLRERRQLEARSFAEQRRRERELTVAEPEDVAEPIEQVPEEAIVTGSPVEQVQEEAAVTESPAEQVPEEATVTERLTERSYADLINEFLKEYPA